MLSLYEILKASKTGIAPDMWTSLAGANFGGAGSGAETKEITGIPPLSIRSNGTMLLDYLISGNMSQTGTPTPTTPIQPQETGERTENLINVPALSGVRWATQYPALLAVINSLPNGVYTMSISYELTSRNDVTDNSVCGWYIAKGSSTLSNIRHSWYTAPIGTVHTVSDTFTINDNKRGSLNALYLYGCGIDGYGATGTANVSNIMLNTGSETLPYEPWGIKTPISSGGENLFDDFDIVGQVPSVSNGNLVSYTNGACTDFIEISTGLLTLSIFESMVVYVFLYDANKSFLGWANITSSGTRKITNYKNAKYARVRTDDYSTYLNEKKIMLNLGATALPYEPYIEPTETNIYLGEVETTRRIKKLVLTGEERDWVNAVGITATNAYQNATATTGYKRETFYCSHMVVTTDSTSTTTHGYIGQRLTLCMDKTLGLDTVDKFKSYLAAQYAAGTPVTVWYVLAEPETGIVNEPLRKIGDYVDTVSYEQAQVSIPTNKGNTVIDVLTELKPSEVYLKYYE